MIRLKLRVFWMLLAAGLAGRVAAQPAPVLPPQTGVSSDADLVVGAASGIPRLKVLAPPALKVLLDTYLDLARAIKLPDAAQISDSEWSRLIVAMPAQAIELAKTEGYFEAQAQVRQQATDSDSAAEATTGPEVVLQMTPGQPSRIGELQLDLQGPLAALANATTEAEAAPARSLQAAVRAQWLLPAGTVFTTPAWDEAKNGVLAQLRAAGYASARWSTTAAEVDVQTRQVRLTLVLDSGPLYRAGPIEVSGLVHHSAEQVRHLAAFDSGAALTELRLQDYQERLSKTGLFDQVSVSIVPDPSQAEHTRILVRVKETPLHSATTSLGVSANSGPRAALEHSYRRVAGLPLTSRLKLEWGRKRQAGDAELSTHADQTLSRYIFGASEERLLTDTDMVRSLKLRAGRSQDKPSVERYNFAELEQAEECALDGNKLTRCARLTAASANTYSTWRRVDNVLLPTNGYTLSTQAGVGLAQGTDSSSGMFGRAYGRLTGYWPVGGWYSQARLELGRVLTPAGVQVPDSLRFRAGGDNSVRGYAWRTLAPTRSDGSVTGGRMLFTGSAELAHPLMASQPALWGALFVDTGRAADQLSELRPAWGYGLGVRWRSPVGPLNLDWAWGDEVHRGRLHLNVGVAF